MSCALPIVMRVITPLHVGTGRSAGFIDLEIAREKSTGWPVVPGSSFKGVIRDAATWREMPDGYSPESYDVAVDRLAPLLGREGREGESTAGALCATDLRILLFPVRSFYGGFAYVTCPVAIRRFDDLLAASGMAPAGLRFSCAEGECLVGGLSALMRNDKVFLEELDFGAMPQDLSALAERIAGPAGLAPAELASHLTVVSDTAFAFFCQTATEVTTKVTLKFGSKTAADKGLRTEESVPAEAVFYGALVFQPTRSIPNPEAGRNQFRSYKLDVLQFGGKAGTGQGICRLGEIR